MRQVRGPQRLKTLLADAAAIAGGYGVDVATRPLAPPSVVRPSSSCLTLTYVLFDFQIISIYLQQLRNDYPLCFVALGLHEFNCLKKRHCGRRADAV